MPEAELAGDVQVLRRHHARLDQLDRLDHQRGDQPGGDEAGDVAVDHDAGLADLLGKRPCRGQRRVATSCSRGPARRASSSERARRSAFPPPTRAGSVTAAIWVTGMAEVFVANTASARQMRSRSRNTACLTSSCSNTASTTMSASAAASRSVVVAIRPSVASTSSPVIAPLLANRVQRGTDAADAPLHRRLVQVAQRHRPTRLRRHLGDARTHQSGADDRDPTSHVPVPFVVRNPRARAATHLPASPERRSALRRSGGGRLAHVPLLDSTLAQVVFAFVMMSRRPAYAPGSCDLYFTRRPISRRDHYWLIRVQLARCRLAVAKARRRPAPAARPPAALACARAARTMACWLRAAAMDSLDEAHQARALLSQAGIRGHHHDGRRWPSPRAGLHPRPAPGPPAHHPPPAP